MKIINDYDKYVYEKELKNFLPDKMFDAHVHISVPGLKAYGSHNGGSTWTDYLPKDMPIADFLDFNKQMFPNQEVSALIFGRCLTEINATNEAIIKENKGYNFPTLYRSDYAMDPDLLEANVKAGGFLGLKPYLSNCPSYIPSNEVRIFDFLPHAQLEVANKNGWIIMLHIPRNDRLKDPVNLAQIIEIEEKYPNIKLIVAHIGRAYAREDFGNVFEILKNTKNMMFDFTANLLDEAMIEGIKTVGVDRFMYGTDLPIAIMRMYRIVENGTYYNIVPKGLYGDVNGQPHMRDEENDKITLMAYEQLLAFKRASAQLKLSDTDIEKILYSNIKNLTESVKG